MGWLTILLVLIGVIAVPVAIGNYVAKLMRSPESATGLSVILFSILVSGIVIFAALQPEKEESYTVEEGDTVQTIVERLEAEKGLIVGVKALTDMNNLQSVTDLKAGDVLRVPNPKRLEIKRGVDLSGGVILIYEVDDQKDVDGNEPGEAPDLDALVDALARRINPGGVKEVVIRKYGAKQVEIIIPDVDDAEVERIKRHITQAGYLRFLIIAKRADHPKLFALAAAQPNARVLKDGTLDKDGKEKTLGEWVAIGREEDGTTLRVSVDPNINLVREPRPGVVEVLMYHDRYRVEGGDIASVSPGFDDRMQNAINFNMNGGGTRKFRGLTSTNLPDQQTGRSSRLGIIMDDELISAPTIQSTISDRGQITGGFSQEYVDEMVNILRAGRLPAVLKTEPITESRIDPLLGQETIEKGAFAIGASLIAVLVFMALYYRFAGLVACFALLLNLLLILALMILIRGAFTLPGLAGLVLTVGMSVDANVLIFERIREELKRGSALRMAIRNGFARATTTIVDANITTLITAVVLYVIGTDQLRGFAVTLILGILMSMFTAIYCSRVVFDLAERRRFLRKLTMTQLLDEPKLDLIGKRGVAALISIVLIVIGLGAVGARKAGILDIDFLGGTSVQAELKQPMPYSDVWDRISDLSDVSLTQVSSSESPRDTIWKIDTSLEDNLELQKQLVERFEEGDASLLKSHTVSFEPPQVVSDNQAVAPAAGDGGTSAVTDLPDLSAAESDPAEGGEGDAEADEGTGDTQGGDGDSPAGDASDTPAGDASDAPAGDASDAAPEVNESSRTDLPGYDVLAQADDLGAGADADAAPADGTTTSPDDGSGTLVAPETTPSVQSRTTIQFGQRVTKDTLEQSIREAAESLPGVNEPAVELLGPQGEADSPKGFLQWQITANTTPENLEAILTKLKTDLESRPAWRSSSKIGGKVAGDTQSQAVAAILISLVCIVGYLWIRFQRVVFGLSAVVALVHDVLITLGAIAISRYLAGPMGFLLIDEFKISLPVVAAFLTIIGYSLNDTIVVFDRIREVKGRSQEITAEMINKSINQTLSRTLLTSATTLLVVLILFIFGGQGIHGFAFALLVGVLVGTYSSIFVASPALLWMSKFMDSSNQQQGDNASKKAAAAK